MPEFKSVGKIKAKIGAIKENSIDKKFLQNLDEENWSPKLGKLVYNEGDNSH